MPCRERSTAHSRTRPPPNNARPHTHAHTCQEEERRPRRSLHPPPTELVVAEREQHGAAAATAAAATTGIPRGSSSSAAITPPAMLSLQGSGPQRGKPGGHEGAVLLVAVLVPCAGGG